jgi:PAS domain S-box-containing protein
VAVGACGVALLMLPWRVCAIWLAIGLAVECWSWFASRPQHLGRTVDRTAQLNYLANLTALIVNWFMLALLFWRTRAPDGAVCAIVIWLSIIGFAQTFASRTPLGFMVCGVAPALGMLGVALAGTHYGGMDRRPILGILICAIGFAIAGARQTFAAGRKFYHTQQLLCDSEAQYRVLADNVTDIIGLTSLSGEWRYISPSVEMALGYTVDEFRALPHFSYVHPDDQPGLQPKIDQMLVTGGACTVEYRLVRKDGSLTWMETSFTVINDPRTGAPLELASLSRDVNHRKAMEQELMQALESAEAGAAAKANFLANMTHELRTPLNAIIGFSGILKTSKDLTAKDGRHAGLISDASSTLLGVVNSVLDFSKLESGVFEFDAQPFHPGGMARSVAMLLETQAAARRISLDVVAADDIRPLSGDAPRLQQVLLNLLSNAVKFTEQGGVTVRVEQDQPSDVGCRLRVSVTDTGIGIASSQLDAVFERFNQADGSVSRRFGGTGLGLAISKRIVELMGGRIGVTSQEGQGSTFWFELVLPPALISIDAAGEETAQAGLERPIRVLLVEDVDVNRELVCAMLEPFEIDIETAINGAEALEAVGNARFDAVLMDIQMPVMDGMTAMRRIRAMADPEINGLPIIAMTANVLPEQIQRCLEAGADDHVGKPINIGQLLEVLSRWTGDEREAGETRREMSA